MTRWKNYYKRIHNLLNKHLKKNCFQQRVVSRRQYIALIYCVGVFFFYNCSLYEIFTSHLGYNCKKEHFFFFYLYNNIVITYKIIIISSKYISGNIIYLLYTNKKKLLTFQNSINKPISECVRAQLTCYKFVISIWKIQILIKRLIFFYFLIII